MTTGLDGIYPDMPERDYHADPSLSSTGAKLLLPPSCPAKYRERMDNPPNPKPNFDFGHLVHHVVLRKGAPIAEIGAADYKTQAARKLRDLAHENGEIPALTHELTQATFMASQVFAHPVAGPLLTSGDAETSLFTTDPDAGVRMRARPDWMTQRDGRLWLVDLKTTVDANPDTFGRAAHKWGYHIQCAWYCTVARLLELDESPAFVLVCVEKEPPYLVSVCEFDMDAYLLGRKQMQQAIQTYQRCMETGEWPGYDQTIHSISLPPWAFADDQPTVNDLLEGATQ